MAKPQRDEFSAKTKRDLAARAGHVCSFPGCGRSTSGPSAEANDASVNLGEACHISAAASGPGARRYDPALTSNERSSIENGIWLCRTHAKLIDSDEATYTVEQLQLMKREAEGRAEQRLRSGSGGLVYRAKLPARDFFVHRKELDMVRGSLTQAAGSTVGITTALRGAGGFGKTALAARRPHQGVVAVAVLDEKRVVSASWDYTLRVWDVEFGETMAVFALDAPVLAVAARSRVVVAGDEGGGVHFFDFDVSS